VIKYEIIKKRQDIFLRLFGVGVLEFEEILRNIQPLWQKEILGKYKRPGRFHKVDLKGQILILLLCYRHYITQEFTGMFRYKQSQCVSRHKKA
jgi:hypothetical protein